MKLVVQTVILASAIASVSCAGKRNQSALHAGVSDTGGGNHGDLAAREHRLAWFTGHESISYCIEIGTGVNVPAVDLAKLFDNAFAVWSTSQVVRDANQVLRANGAEILPTKAKYLPDNCSGANLVVGFGSHFDRTQYNDKILESRESTISGGYGLQYGRYLMWIAGSVEAPIATGTLPENRIRSINYSDLDEVSATLRYTIGRMLGNVRTPGTLMDQLPEDLIMCARDAENKNNAACKQQLKSGVLANPYSIVTRTETVGMPITGCMGSAGLVSLQVEPNSQTLIFAGTESDRLTLKWESAPTVASIQKIEAFATDKTQRFFFEQMIVSGRISRDANDSDYIRVYVNATDPVTKVDYAGRVTVHCDDGDHVIFQSAASCAPRTQNIQQSLSAILSACK